MMGLTEVKGHLFYDGRPFLMFRLAMSLLQYNKVKFHKHCEMCQILIGNFGRFFIFCSQNFI